MAPIPECDMPKREAKTVPRAGDPEDFIAALSETAQQADCRSLLETFTRLAGEKATMWGPSMIGFGRFHYRYASGHEGEIFRIGFSPRKGKISLYLWPGLDFAEPMLARLGKHSRGKGCLYVRRLADIDMAVLEEMVIACLAVDPQELISRLQGER